MQQLSRWIILGLGISGASLCTSAMAQLSSSANLNITQFELLDLDLSDGITPNLQILNIYNVSATYLRDMGVDQEFFDYRSPADLAVNSIANTLNNFSSGGSYSGGLLGNQAAYGQVSGVGPGIYYGYSNIEFDFVLTPNTQLILAGHASGSEVPISLPSSEPYRTTGSTITLRKNWGDFVGSFADSTASHTSYDRDFSIVFNNGGSEFVGEFKMRTYADGISPVPEPASYAMMLLGLGVLGMVARRRTRPRSSGSPIAAEPAKLITPCERPLH